MQVPGLGAALARIVRRMTHANRPVQLLWLAALALGCGSVTSLSTDAATDKGGAAGSSGAAGGGSTGTAGSTGQAGSGGAGAGSSGTTGSGGGGVSGTGGGGGTSGHAGTDGHAGAGGATGSGGAGGRGGAGGQGGAGGSGVCSVACTRGRMCCGGTCVNLNNDPMNCGVCGTHCTGTTNLCSGGNCVAPPCSTNPAAGACAPTSFCCGSGCCLPGQLCCESDGPVSGGPPTCFTPTADQKTCAQGCAPLCVSDRNQKKNITPVDAAAILDKVSRLPISTWTYLREPTEVRHLGPMAQDFRATFGLGDDDRTYYSVDAQGVALAAIKALNDQFTAQEARIEELARANHSLARRLREVGKCRR